MIEDSIFSGIYGESGGAIFLGYIDLTNVVLRNNIFVNNFAYLKGGAIFVKTLSNSNVFMENNTFENNLANEVPDIYIHHPLHSELQIEITFMNNTFKNSFASS